MICENLHVDWWNRLFLICTHECTSDKKSDVASHPNHNEASLNYVADAFRAHATFELLSLWIIWCTITTEESLVALHAFTLGMISISAQTNLFIGTFHKVFADVGRTPFPSLRVNGHLSFAVSVSGTLFARYRCWGVRELEPTFWTGNTASIRGELLSCDTFSYCGIYHNRGVSKRDWISISRYSLKI